MQYETLMTGFLTHRGMVMSTGRLGIPPVLAGLGRPPIFQKGNRRHSTWAVYRNINIWNMKYGRHMVINPKARTMNPET